MFRKNKDEQEQRSGRYVVEHMPTVGKGRFWSSAFAKQLEDKLNNGEAQGWALKSTFTPSEIHSVYIVWDTKATPG